MRNLRGFTLIELMVTIAIVVTLTVLGAPSFIAFQRNSEMTSRINALFSAINTARSEALKRGRYTMVVPFDSANWSSGWIVFVDVNRTQSYDSNADYTVFRLGDNPRDAFPDYLVVDTAASSGVAIAAPPYILFNPGGYPRTKAAGPGNFTLTLKRTDVSGNDIYKQTRRLIVDRLGRVKVCTPTSAADGNCAAPP